MAIVGLLFFAVPLLIIYRTFFTRSLGTLFKNPYQQELEDKIFHALLTDNDSSWLLKEVYTTISEKDRKY